MGMVDDEYVSNLLGPWPTVEGCRAWMGTGIEGFEVDRAWLGRLNQICFGLTYPDMSGFGACSSGPDFFCSAKIPGFPPQNLRPHAFPRIFSLYFFL